MIRFLYDTEGAPSGGDSGEATTGGEPSGNEAGGEAGGSTEQKSQIFKEQLKKELRDHEALSDVEDFNDLTSRYISLQEQSNIQLPRSADEYDFGEPEEGVERDEEFEQSFREMALNNKLSNEQAVGVVSGLAEILKGRHEAQQAQVKELGEKVMNDIGKDGKFRAEKFLKQYGGEELMRAAMENPGQHEQILRIAAEAGKLISEDTLPEDSGGGEDNSEMSLAEMFTDMPEYFPKKR
jgi:hypothetical protein